MNYLLQQQAMTAFAKVVDKTRKSFENFSTQMIKNYLEKPNVVLIWNGRKFKKKVTQWKQIKINYGVK